MPKRFPVKSLNGIVTQNHRIMTWLFGYQPLVAVSIRFRYMRRIQASGSGTYQQLFASSYAANTLGRNTPLHPHRTLLAKVQAFVPDTSLTISIRNFGQPNMCCCPAKSNMFLAGSSSIAAATRDSIQCQWVMWLADAHGNRWAQDGPKILGTSIPRANEAITYLSTTSFI